MSPASYRAAPPRVGRTTLHSGLRFAKIDRPHPTWGTDDAGRFRNLGGAGWTGSTPLRLVRDVGEPTSARRAEASFYDAPIWFCSDSGLGLRSSRTCSGTAATAAAPSSAQRRSG